jgi:hypothetical protein
LSRGIRALFWRSSLAAESREEAANLSAGLVRNAVTDETPMIGIEPSAILGSRDKTVFQAASCSLRGN